MIKLFSILLFTFIAIVPGVSKAAYTYVDQYQQCGAGLGFSNKCKPGFVCRITEKNEISGICVPDPASTVMCRMLDYIVGTGDGIGNTARGNARTLMQKIALFSFVILGLGFFLGKISWGMIINVIIGVMLIFSARTLIDKIITPDKIFTRYCSDLNASGFTVSSTSKDPGDMTACVLQEESGLAVNPTREVTFASVFNQELNVGYVQRAGICQNSSHSDFYKCRVYECKGVPVVQNKAISLKGYVGEVKKTLVYTPTYIDTKTAYVLSNSPVNAQTFLNPTSVTSEIKDRSAINEVKSDLDLEDFSDGSADLTDDDGFWVNPDQKTQKTRIINSIKFADSDISCEIKNFTHEYKYFQCVRKCGDITLKTYHREKASGGKSSCEAIFNIS